MVEIPVFYCIDQAIIATFRIWQWFQRGLESQNREPLSLRDLLMVLVQGLSAGELEDRVHEMETVALPVVLTPTKKRRYNPGVVPDRRFKGNIHLPVPVGKDRDTCCVVCRVERKASEDNLFERGLG